MKISLYSTQDLSYLGGLECWLASFIPEERYSLVDQIRRSSRAVCSNLAEAWRKRK